MKKKILAIPLSIVFLAFSLPSVLANTPPSSLTMEDMLARLDQAGYRQIHQIKYKDGVYNVETYNDQGQEIELNIDPQNVVIPPKKGDKPVMTILQVARKVGSQGYTRIEEIQIDDGNYEVKAYDAKGSSVKLEVDPVTGRINKQLF